MVGKRNAHRILMGKCAGINHLEIQSRNKKMVMWIELKQLTLHSELCTAGYFASGCGGHTCV
jgi:hypothetical protein